MKFRFAYSFLPLLAALVNGCAQPSAAISAAPATPPAPTQTAVAAPAPAQPVAALPAVTPAVKPTLYVVGDSTANSSPSATNNIRGWGNVFAPYFDSEKITVQNRARGGRSSRSFIHEGLWDAVLQNLQPGDFVLLQFGHNDGGTPGQGTRPERPSLRGVGDETVDVVTNGQPEIVHTFGYNMRKYVMEAKAKGATIIVLTPTVRNNWQDGHIERGLGNYGPWSIEVAQSQRVPLVDMNRIAADKYDALGQEAVVQYYSPDRTHSSPDGADFNAAVIVSGLKALNGNPLGQYLSEKGQAVPTAEAKYVSNNPPATTP